MHISETALFAAYRFHRDGKRSHLALAIPASRALELARQDVANGTTRYPAASGYNPEFELTPRTHLRWIEKPSACGLRFVGYADKLLPRLDHTGWYTDNDQSETARGVVFQLPGRKGRPLFIAGYSMSYEKAADSDGPVCLDFNDVEFGETGDAWSNDPRDHDAAKTQARYADQLAERLAESEREYRAASDAGQAWSDNGELIASTRASVLELLAERKKARAMSDAQLPTICAVIRDKVSDLLSTIADARAERAKLANGDFISTFLPGFNDRDPRLRAAFNESAGQVVI